MTLLTILHLPQGKANYNQIAGMMGFSKQNAKKLVAVLERKNFVKIEKDTDDHRAVNIKVTEDCKTFLHEYYDRGNAYLNEMFHDFEENELQLLWQLLKKLAMYNGSDWTGYEEKVPLD